jgi:DNA-binding transcriptional MerR regulator
MSDVSVPRREMVLRLHRKGVSITEIADLYDGMSDDEVVSIINAARSEEQARIVSAIAGPRHPPMAWPDTDD